ncbi:FK506-binding protein 2-1 [Hordeum vulgare]|nr:FK506-binding protein 2-1 [Hordeum vulgare]
MTKLYHSGASRMRSGCSPSHPPSSSSVCVLRAKPPHRSDNGGPSDHGDVRCFLLNFGGERRVLVLGIEPTQKQVLAPVETVGRYAIFIGHQKCLVADAAKFPSVQADCVYHTLDFGKFASIWKHSISDGKDERVFDAIGFVKEDKRFDSMRIAGIRSDLAEIGGRVRKVGSFLKDGIESQSACSRKVGSFLKDGMEVLDTMSEVSPREEIVESYPIGFETISNSGNELKLIHTESTSTDYSTERSSQNLSAQNTSGVQLPVDNSYLVNSVCFVPGYQNDLAVTKLLA